VITARALSLPPWSICLLLSALMGCVLIFFGFTAFCRYGFGRMLFFSRVSVPPFYNGCDPTHLVADVFLSRPGIATAPGGATVRGRRSFFRLCVLIDLLVGIRFTLDEAS